MPSAAYQKQWRETHPEQTRRYSRNYRAKHADQLQSPQAIASRRDYYLAHRENALQHAAQQYAEKKSLKLRQEEERITCGRALPLIFQLLLLTFLTHRPCQVCHTVKHFDAFRLLDNQWYSNTCLDCRYKAKRERRQNDPAWRTQENIKATIRERQRYKRDHESIRKKARARNALIPKSIRNAQTTRWRRQNPDAFHAICKRRKAKIRGSALNTLTRAQWNWIKMIYHHRCAYCGKKPRRLTQDHIIPLALGGQHTAENVVPACQSCNSKKWLHAPPTFQTILPLYEASAAD